MVDTMIGPNNSNDLIRNLFRFLRDVDYSSHIFYQRAMKTMVSTYNADLSLRGDGIPIAFADSIDDFRALEKHPVVFLSTYNYVPVTLPIRMKSGSEYWLYGTINSIGGTIMLQNYYSTTKPQSQHLLVYLERTEQPLKNVLVNKQEGAFATTIFFVLAEKSFIIR